MYNIIRHKMNSRKCYVLTCNERSPRTQFTKSILEKVGFQVYLFRAIPHKDKVLSNKISMMTIYNYIVNGDDEWVYIFEDDINILENISLEEIIKYEALNKRFFYLGVCDYVDKKIQRQGIKINNTDLTIVRGGVRGLHAIGISKKGAMELHKFAKSVPKQRYMDVCLEMYSIIHPTFVVRYDLESYISGHRGIFFQDRSRFPSSI